jgi:hypothetical protein
VRLLQDDLQVGGRQLRDLGAAAVFPDLAGLPGDLDAIRRSRSSACLNPRAFSQDRWGVPPALVAGRRDLVEVSTSHRAV